jgi:hypothetical protein
MTILAGWLIVGTAIIAGLAGKYYRRQNEATARIEREVIFNDKILANMPSGIALIDPETRRFLQANEAFGQMARRFGNLSPEREMSEASFDEVGIAPPEAIQKVLSFGTPFQLVEAASCRSGRGYELCECQSAAPARLQAEGARCAVSGGGQNPATCDCDRS